MAAVFLLFTPVSITTLFGTEDARFILNGISPIAKGDLKWRDALLVAHRVNSNTYFLCAISLLIGFPFSENFCSYSVIIFPSFISS